MAGWGCGTQPGGGVDEARVIALDILGDTEGATAIVGRRLRHPSRVTPAN